MCIFFSLFQNIDVVIRVPRGDKRDVVFLIDGTTKMRTQFPAIRDMVQRVVEKLDVGLDNVRVSVVQYSDDPKLEFLLNEYSTKEEVRQSIRRMRSKGGNQLNTGQALEYVSKTIYQRSAGSRVEEGVPQFLILVTGGKSNDDVSGPANQLKLSRVAPLAVGAHDADAEELKLISFSPELTYTIRDFQQLPAVEQQLLTKVSTMTRDDISTPPIPKGILLFLVLLKSYFRLINIIRTFDAQFSHVMFIFIQAHNFNRICRTFIS